MKELQIFPHGANDLGGGACPFGTLESAAIGEKSQKAVQSGGIVESVFRGPRFAKDGNSCEDLYTNAFRGLDSAESAHGIAEVVAAQGVRFMRRSSRHESGGQRFVVEGGAALPPRFASEASGAVVKGPFAAHGIEQSVQRELLAQPSLHFSSLVVRRINNGVCLQGVIEADSEVSADVARIAQRITGVQQVLNRLVVAPRRELTDRG